MNHMTVGTKFALTCAALVAFTVLLGGICVDRFSVIESNLSVIVNDSLPAVLAVNAADSEFQNYRGNAWKHIASPDSKQFAAVEQQMDRDKQKIFENLRAYEHAITRTDERALFAKVRPAMDRYFAAWEPVRELSRGLKNEEAYASYMRNADPAFRAARDTLVALVDWNRAAAEQNGASAAASSNVARKLSWILLLVALAVGTLLAVSIVRGTNRALRQIVTELAAGSGQVASAAGQVSSSSQSLAQGSSEQAASLEETSASTEEINSMAQKNSEHAEDAARLMAESKASIHQANRLLDESVVAMEQLNVQSGKIANIIKTIDEIAFQTNILALNAAVEAARAGESGMGGAVVADEVRALAQRSAQAAKDTAELIEQSIIRSREGKHKVDQVAVAVRSVTEQAEKVNQLVDEVKVGSQEQARGIDQIGRAITQMQTVTQHTASNSEESAAAAEELNAQSAAMKDIVARLSLVVGGAEDNGARRTRHSRSGERLTV